MITLITEESYRSRFMCAHGIYTISAEAYC